MTDRRIRSTAMGAFQQGRSAGDVGELTFSVGGPLAWSETWRWAQAPTDAHVIGIRCGFVTAGNFDIRFYAGAFDSGFHLPGLTAGPVFLAAGATEAHAVVRPPVQAGLIAGGSNFWIWRVFPNGNVPVNPVFPSRGSIVVEFG